MPRRSRPAVIDGVKILAGPLVVADDGPGVTAQEYESIFERFVRGTSGVAGGSGLGLALVREAARAHGGDAIAEPDANGGLRVIVTWKCWLSRQHST